MQRQKAASSSPGKSQLETFRPSQFLLISGCLLVVGGLLHTAIWVVSGEPWGGSISWRKPILFGVSGGLTLISMGLLTQHLAPSVGDRWIARSLGVSMLLEVGLITAQQWRGAASHFNRSTLYDSFIDTSISILTGVVALCITILSTRGLRFMSGEADQKLAWRSGLIFLLLSCGIGIIIYAYGVVRSSAGSDPTVFGSSGVVKFPHGMAIHAIQLLPSLCWLMTRVRISLPTRITVLRSMNISVACLLGYSVVQTLSGRARSDFTFLSGCILFVAAAFAWPLFIVMTYALLGWSTSKTLAVSRDTP